MYTISLKALKPMKSLRMDSALTFKSLEIHFVAKFNSRCFRIKSFLQPKCPFDSIIVIFEYIDILKEIHNFTAEHCKIISRNLSILQCLKNLHVTFSSFHFLQKSSQAPILQIKPRMTVFLGTIFFKKLHLFTALY